MDVGTMDRGVNKEGREVAYCPACGRFHTLNGRFEWRCPVCGNGIIKCKCFRCGHEWYPRKPFGPLAKNCPKCKSPYWNRERMRS